MDTMSESASHTHLINDGRWPKLLDPPCGEWGYSRRVEDSAVSCPKCLKLLKKEKALATMTVKKDRRGKTAWQRGVERISKKYGVI